MQINASRKIQMHTAADLCRVACISPLPCRPVSLSVGVGGALCGAPFFLPSALQHAYAWPHKTDAETRADKTGK